MINICSHGWIQVVCRVPCIPMFLFCNDYFFNSISWHVVFWSNFFNAVGFSCGFYQFGCISSFSLQFFKIIYDASCIAMDGGAGDDDLNEEVSIFTIIAQGLVFHLKPIDGYLWGKGGCVMKMNIGNIHDYKRNGIMFCFLGAFLCCFRSVIN